MTTVTISAISHSGNQNDFGVVWKIKGEHGNRVTWSGDHAELTTRHTAYGFREKLDPWRMHWRVRRHKLAMYKKWTDGSLERESWTVTMEVSEVEDLMNPIFLR